MKSFKIQKKVIKINCKKNKKNISFFSHFRIYILFKTENLNNNLTATFQLSLKIHSAEYLHYCFNHLRKLTFMKTFIKRLINRSRTLLVDLSSYLSINEFDQNKILCDKIILNY
ncbi:hypothetical protein BpHYR1_025562 [Brachionus plicatilis]|uniref:Uncharacterized protein n=1 Tax=Brachionus plicatilis TaxID=10195 RepID=A0A3M7Q2R9_BRAPC|nr:hypothetical protein BpHYR1_025562 [Brachionus plicatilis]